MTLEIFLDAVLGSLVGVLIFAAASYLIIGGGVAVAINRRLVVPRYDSSTLWLLIIGFLICVLGAIIVPYHFFEPLKADWLWVIRAPIALISAGVSIFCYWQGLLRFT